MHGLVKGLGIAKKHVEVFCDSQSAIYLTKNQVHHAREPSILMFDFTSFEKLSMNVIFNY